MQRRAGFSLFLLLIVGLVVGGCAPEEAFVPTPTKTPAAAGVEREAAATEPPAQTEVMAAAPAAGETPVIAVPSATETPTPAPEAGGGGSVEASLPNDVPVDGAAMLLNDHYWMQRPIGPEFRNYLDRTYPYGSTAGGRLRVHSGVEFQNPEGTPALAVANATVFYSGTDEATVVGPDAGFYGNVIILQLDNTSYGGQPVYALYGHLSAIDVQVGETVEAGQAIGAVGGTGIANGGAHLHFEVRVGDPMGYGTSTRNPDLWIGPYPGYGTLAGRISGPDGAPLPEVAIHIAGEDMPRYGSTYAEGEEVHADDEYGENFTYGDLPQGWYDISVNSGRKIYRERVYIEAGRTSWLEIQFEE